MSLYERAALVSLYVQISYKDIGQIRLGLTLTALF
jgi:hypothetical protein